MQLFPVQGPVDLSGATIVMPAVTIGNVGELAMDVLITSLQGQGDASSAVKLVARLEDSCVLPVVGADAYNLHRPGTLATALELYHITGTQVYLLQQRSPARTGGQQEHGRRLVAWMTTAGVARAVVLGALEDATLKKDAQLLSGVAFRYMPCEGSQDDATCQALHWPRLEQELIDEEQQLHNLLPPWTLLAAAQKSNLATLLLTVFASEGDNRQDGLQLAARSAQWLHATGSLAASPEALSNLGLTSSQPSTGPQASGGGMQVDSGVQEQSQDQPVRLKLATPCSWSAVYGYGSRMIA